MTPHRSCRIALLGLAPLLMAPKCIDYVGAPADGDADAGEDAGEPMDAADDGDAADAGEDAASDASPSDGSEPPPLSIDGMVDAACVVRRCTAGQVVRYWEDDWEESAVERTLTFEDPAEGSARFVVRDASGAPTSLQFEAGVPVTLRVISPGDGTATAAHDLTAPQFFRSVAWFE